MDIGLFISQLSISMEIFEFKMDKWEFSAPIHAALMNNEIPDGFEENITLGKVLLRTVLLKHLLDTL